MSAVAIDVRPATATDEATVIGVITLAFSTDPMARWAFGDTRTYLAVMPAFVRAFGGNGLAHGATHLVDGGWAAAMWLPPGVQPDADTMMVMTVQLVRKELMEEQMQVVAQMVNYYPEVACW